MPTLEAFLHRLRIHGVPGAAGAAGVPVDRAAEVTAELEPIFELLEGAERRVAQLLAEGEEHVAQARAQASEDARRLLADARADVEGQRARAAAATLARSADARRAVLAEGRAEAERVDRVVLERMASVRAELVRRVLSTGSPTS